MSRKKLSEKTYKILETVDAHLPDSKETVGAKRAVEFDSNNKMLGPVELVEFERTRYSPKSYEEFSIGEQLIIKAADIIISRATDYLSEKAIVAFERWWKNRGQLNRKVKQGNIFTQKTKAAELLQRSQSSSVKVIHATNIAPCESFLAFNTVYEEYRINMTNEEVQKELVDIFMLSAIRARKIWKISHANIVESPDVSVEHLEGSALIERITAPEVLNSINTIIEGNISLVEEWELIALSDILGRELITGGRYIPIEGYSFRKCLTMNMLS